MKSDTFALLAVLADGEADATGIVERLEAAGGAPAIPTLYRRLSECVESGWVEIVGQSAEGGRGRPGQMYRLTRAGRSVARAEAVHWRGLTDRLLPE